MINKQKTLIVGHRGYSAMYPENTKLSFEKALEFGFNGVELDVHLTKDQRLVVIHDENTIRTSNFDLEIQNTTLAELKAIDYTTKFKPCLVLNERMPEQDFLPQTILTFEEFLEMFSDKFEVINLEVKTDIIEYKDIEVKILEALKDYRDKTHFILTSFNDQTIFNLRELDKEIELGFLIYEAEVYKNLDEAGFLKITNACQYISILDDLLIEDRELIDKFNLPYMLWQWRRGDQVLNYSKKDQDSYFHFKDDKDIYLQIVDYKWD